MSQSSDQDFLELKRMWYARLKQEGFSDIENTNRSDHPLTCWHSNKWKKVPSEKIALTKDYYIRAEQLLTSYKFESDIHKKIWELHAQGLSKRKIEKQINGAFKRESIGIIIKTIAVKANITNE